MDNRREEKPGEDVVARLFHMYTANSYETLIFEYPISKL